VSDSLRLTGWRLNRVRIFVLLAVIAITVFVFSIRDQAEELAAYGYPGIFLLSILANATLILPAPSIALTFHLRRGFQSDWGCACCRFGFGIWGINGVYGRI